MVILPSSDHQKYKISMKLCGLHNQCWYLQIYVVNESLVLFITACCLLDVSFSKILAECISRLLWKKEKKKEETGFFFFSFFNGIIWCSLGDCYLMCSQLTMFKCLRVWSIPIMKVSCKSNIPPRRTPQPRHLKPINQSLLYQWLNWIDLK